MRTILVKFLGPTATKPSRYKVSSGDKSRVYSKYGCIADGVKNDEEIVKKCAKHFIQYRKWDHENKPTSLTGGQLPNGDYVFIFAGSHLDFTIEARQE